MRRPEVYRGFLCTRSGKLPVFGRVSRPCHGWNPSDWSLYIKPIVSLSRVALLATAVWLVPALAVAQQVEVRVNGDFPELQRNAEAFIGDVEGRSEDNLRRYTATAVDQARQALRALGYYAPTIEPTLVPGDDERTARLILDIEPGQPVRVVERTVEIRGAGASDPKMTGDLPHSPAVGEVLDHGAYAELRNLIQTRARRRGYFNGRFVARTLEVDPEQLSARIVLVYQTGPRYRLGEVRFDGDPWFELSLLEDYVTFEPGTPYHADKIADLNSDLSNSGFFSVVNIDASPANAVDAVIPVIVTLQRRDPRSVAGGVGFSTDIGPRFRGTWREHWINPRGHRRGAETEISGPRQNVSAWYELPLDPPMTDLIRFAGGYQRSDIDDIESERLTLAQQWQHELDSDWLQVLSLRWEGEQYQIRGDERGTSSLLLPGVGYSRLYQNSPLDPSLGYRLQIDTSGAHRAVLSDVDILHMDASAKGLFTLADRHRFLIRARLGAVATNSFEDVPPSLRFFAGGDQSVRGYAYESLSPENDNGVEVGGRYLIVGSIEYQYQFANKWRVAWFFDHGNAVNDLLDPLASGAGAGLRWISPVGPLRFDIAKGLNPELGGEWRVHFSMGPEL